MAPSSTSRDRTPIHFGAHRLRFRPGVDDLDQRNRAMLYRVLNLGTTVAVVGSGCSGRYPSWQNFIDGLLQATLEVVAAQPQANRLSAEVKYLKGRLCQFQNSLQDYNTPREHSLPPADLLRAGAGCCDRLRSPDTDSEPDLRESLQQGYSEFLKKTFGPAVASLPDDEANPYRALAGLPIKRFVTTNYDCALEATLGIDLNPEEGELENATSERSFTQRGKNARQIIRFPLAYLRSDEPRVFHCHGRYDDPASVVASEADYQRWYLDHPEENIVPFQHAREVLFKSNPLLFVGYGLQDLDLLQPLRMLGAVDPAHRQSRPIFALLDRGEFKNHAEAVSDRLYDQYGLHVIFYEGGGFEEDQLQRAGKLCCAIESLKIGWELAEREWLQKPRPKKLSENVAGFSSAEQPRRCLVTSVDPRDVSRLSEPQGRIPEPVRERILRLLRKNKVGPAASRVIVLRGPAGTEKSKLAFTLVHDRELPAFDSYFYWNSHYSNEAITGLDRLLTFLDPEGTAQGSRLERLRELLGTGRHLVILDGCERLLLPSHRVDEGDAFSPGFRELLKIVAQPKTWGREDQKRDWHRKSVVVLTSRIWPEDLGGPQRDQRTDLVELRPLGIQDFQASGNELQLDDRQKSEACSLLAGHSYGLRLARAYLTKADSTATDRFAKLAIALADKPPDRRLGRMVELLLDDLDSPGNSAHRDHLERLSFFVEPISPEALEVFSRQLPPTVASDAEKVNKALLESSLLFRVFRDGDPEGEPSGYAVHSVVRSHISKRRQASEEDVLPELRPVGFLSRTTAVDPGPRARRERVERLLKTLLDSAETRLKERAKPGAEPAPEETKKARDLCRDAYGLMRSQMECLTAPRWTSYEQYLTYGIRLAMNLKLLSDAAPDSKERGKFWSYCEPHGLRDIESEEGALHAAELAWLYNDVALTLFAEGSVRDAYAVWEQAYEISRLVDGGGEYGEYVAEARLNLALCFIDLGRLAAAVDYLNEVERLNRKLGDQDLHGRILGCRGLIQYLHGDLQTAEALYEAADRIFESTHNSRARSIFLRHLGDVKLEVGDVAAADLCLRTSRSLAEAAQFPDLVAYCHASEGDRVARLGDLPGAHQIYFAGKLEAKRLGIRKLEVLLLTKMASLAYEQGDYERSRTHGLEALRMANELGLELRKTQALLILGRAMAKLDQWKLARIYLELAEELATRQHYWLRGREARECLQSLGEDSPAVAS